MDAPGIVPSSINCHACGAVIDLAGQTPFTHVECPQCSAISVVPVQFGNFLLLNVLGIGGMGTVYKAIDLSLNRYLALKILRRKLATAPDFIQSFSHEARAAASVNHPNAAQVYSFGEQDGQYYLAMELLERGSLDDRMTRVGKLTEQEVLDIGVQIASGLRAAAQRGLLHRDVKPGNILFGEDNTPKIVDFGLAQVSTAAPSQPGQPASSEPVWGTPYYIAPEKLRGQPEDFRSDIYSLGATLFHALAGRAPFEAETADEVATKHTVQPAYSLKTFVPTVQDYTAQVIGRMLAKNPAERYENYDVLIRDLQEAQRVLKAAQSAPAIVSETGERISIASILSTLAALVVCVAVIGVVWKNRVKWFGFEPPATPATSTAATPSSPAAAAPGASSSAGETGEVVDFKEEEPWVKAWNVAVLQLTQGHYTEALLGFDTAKTLLRGHPRHRQWVFFFQGITLLAADRPAESVASFASAMDPLVKPQVPPTITTANFVTSLAQTMLGGLPLADLEKEVPRMPPWAAALTHLTAGFKHIEANEFAPAAEEFRKYKDMEPEDKQSWAFNLQPLADRLAHECDSAALALDKIARLKKDGKPDELMELLKSTAAKTRIASFKALLERDEADVQKTIDQARLQQEQQKQQEEAAQQERDKRDQQKAAEETKLLQSTDAAVTPLWHAYDFKAIETKYEALAPQIETAAGHRLLDQRRRTVALLVEFKGQLTADFPRRSYDSAGLQTRTSVQIAGRLTRATDTQLVFSTQYGELVSEWSDLAPATLQKIAEDYATGFAQTETPETIARRYLTLAAFCRQYGLDRAAGMYAQQAIKLAPSLQGQLDIIFGK